MPECDLQVQMIFPTYLTNTDVLNAIDKAIAVLVADHIDCPNVSVYGLYEREESNNG